MQKNVLLKTNDHLDINYRMALIKFKRCSIKCTCSVSMFGKCQTSIDSKALSNYQVIVKQYNRSTVLEHLLGEVEVSDIIM